MFHDIQTVLSRLTGKVKELLDNNTTNVAECWRHIRTKFDGEKVINRSQSGPWEKHGGRFTSKPRLILGSVSLGKNDRLYYE